MVASGNTELVGFSASALVVPIPTPPESQNGEMEKWMPRIQQQDSGFKG